MCVFNSFAGFAQASLELPATGDQLSLSAKKATFSQSEQNLTASGEVRLSLDRLHLQADRVRFDLQSRRLYATGHVTLLDGERTLQAEEIELSLDDAALIVLQAKVEIWREARPAVNERRPGQRSLLLSGARIEREASGLWRLQDTLFTPCDCGSDEPPSWSARCASAEVHPNDEAILHAPVFLIRDTPVFALPYARVPLARRKTGLLAPSFSYTDRLGFRAQEEMYWAIDAQRDLTLGLDGITERGLRPQLEYRYANAKGKGEFQAGYLYDVKGGSKERIRHRAHLRADQDWRPISGLRQKAQIELYSDSFYRSDFERDWRQRTPDFAVSQLQLHSELPDLFIGARLQLGQALFSPKEVDGSLLTRSANEQLWQLPAARFALPAYPLFNGRLLVSLDLRGDLLYRLSGAYDDSGSDGVFNDAEAGVASTIDYEEGNHHYDFGEPLARAVRLYAAPSLQAPLRLGKIATFTPTLGLRSRVYVPIDVDSSAISEGHVYLDATLQSRLYRVFTLGDGSRLKHELQPVITYHYLPYIYGDDARTASALNLLRPIDDSRAPHWVQAQLLQRFALRDGSSGKIRRFLEFGLGQRLFLDAASRRLYDSRWDDGLMHLNLMLDRLDWRSELGVRWQDGELGSASSRLQVGPFQGIRLAAQYRYLSPGVPRGNWLYMPLDKDDISRHQLSLQPSVVLHDTWSLRYALELGLTPRRLIEQAMVFRYDSPCRCWSAEVSLLHRQGQRAPDVFFTLDLTPLVTGGAGRL